MKRRKLREAYEFAKGNIAIRKRFGRPLTDDSFLDDMILYLDRHKKKKLGQLWTQ